MKYYHITERQKINQILEEGLVPMIGENSRIAMEKEPVVCLCDENSLARWMIMLGRGNEDVIEVDADDLVMGSDFSTSVPDDAEYRLKERIEPSRLRRTENVITQDKYEETMRKMCIDNLYTVSHLCVMCAQYYRPIYGEKEDQEEVEDMLALLQIQTAVLERLDFSAIPLLELKEELHEAGECGISTYDDWYCDTKYKLHQMLGRYPNDSLTTARKRFRRVINRKLKGTLTMNTGGWGDSEAKNEKALI